MMNRILSLKTAWAFCLYIFLDIICIGMGMGVPIACILFGFVVGWYIARRILGDGTDIYVVIKKILLYSVITSLVTFVIMAVLWGWCVVLLFGPKAKLVNFGIPMILYEPKASLIGWLVLMIFISPFLQVLTTIFGSYLTIVFKLKRCEKKE